MTPLLLALLAGVAVLLALEPRAPAPVSRGRRHRPRPGAGTAALLVGAGAALLVGGAGGVAAGLAVAVVVRVLVPRLESEAERRRRDRAARQAPLVVDLVSACLASGARVDAALEAAGRAVGSPSAEVLSTAAASLRLGAEPADVWRVVAEVDGLGGLARAVARSHDTGAPLSQLLPRVADQVRASHRARVESRIRTAGVRLTAPLGAAFLPAFLLLGVVPVIASWVGVLL